MVKHPNVVDIYDLGEEAGRYYIAMEYLEGEPLLSVLRAGREGKRLDVMSTARLIADTAEGLDAAHELRTLAGEAIELVHHDVSLGNIVVLYTGQVKLVDFGVAKASQSAGPQVQLHGKVSYMAPEKLRGVQGDRRSDLWSLGIVLWEALTLRRLFKGGNDSDTMRLVLETTIPAPSAVNPEVPRDLDPIVMKALERDPAKRYATAKQLAADLEAVLTAHQYGGKNDAIAKYMQTTFSAHIAARKKLLQEVSSIGRASADVLHAAFTEGAPTSGEFSVRIRRESGELLTPEEAQLRKRTGLTVPPIRASSPRLEPRAPTNPLGDVIVAPGSGTAAAPRGLDKRLVVLVVVLVLGAAALVIALAR
jgi:serine/threonine-protein kinase